MTFVSRGDTFHAMKLAAYLAREQLSAAEFARQLGVKRGAVTRWLHGDRMPRLAQLRAIKAITHGAVMAGDFYDHAVKSPPSARRPGGRPRRPESLPPQQ